MEVRACFSVMESTERHHRIPPLFNLPITMMDFIHSQCKYNLWQLCPSYGDGPKPYDCNQQEAKGNARALMLKYKKSKRRHAQLRWMAMLSH